MLEEPTMKDLLLQDVRILLNRFQKFELDQDERHWHISRYLNNLNTEDPQTLISLSVAIEEVKTELTQKDALGSDPIYRYSVQALQQMSVAVILQQAKN